VVSQHLGNLPQTKSTQDVRSFLLDPKSSTGTQQ
jgi:hypothetical protein